ncbi:DUF4307 domain-containing protein [Cellulomonas endophytica]|uniref:DUF4307 domain-containing protein n=1 Tax=Cellulomonas endophytica TaxID=2494735 RepID=UPI001F0CD083|nr:DUF4307 domain-containing protein [Cellulomonas endophytica]
MAVAAACAVAVAVVAWVVVGVLRDPVQWQDLGYDVVDAATVQVRFAVTMEPGARAVCQVRALNEAFTEVGFRTVEVSAVAERTQRVTVQVRTTALAVTGSLQGCRLADG